MSELEKLNEAIRIERQQRGLTGKLEDLIMLRKKLLKGK